MAEHIILYDSASTFESNESFIHLSKITTRAENYTYESQDKEVYIANKVTVDDVTTGTHSGKTCLEVDWNAWFRLNHSRTIVINPDIVDPGTLIGLGSVYNYGTGEVTRGVPIDIHIDWSNPANLELHEYGPGWSSRSYGTGYPVCGNTNGNNYIFIYSEPFEYDNYMFNAVLCYIPSSSPRPNAGETVLGASNETVYVNTHDETVMVYEKYESTDVPVISSTTPGVAYVQETKAVAYNMPPITVEVYYDDQRNVATSGLITTNTVKTLDIPFSALVQDATDYLDDITSAYSRTLQIECGNLGGEVDYDFYDNEKVSAFSFFYDFTQNMLKGTITYGKSIKIICSVYNRPL